MDEKLLIETSAKIVQDNVEKFAKGLYGIGKDAVKKQQIEFGNAFTSYLEAAIKKYGNAKTLLYADKPVSLYEFYVNLNISFENEILDTSNILNILDRGKYNLITGTGGIGKSTLFRHLFLNTIENTRLIPVFIQLRDIKRLDTDYTLIDFIHESLKPVKLSLEKKYFEHALKIGAFIFFFDGFDEIDDNLRGTVQKHIEDMCDEFEGNYYFISSRALSEYSSFVSWEKFIRYNICPLNMEQALALVRKLNYDSEIKEKFLIDLKDNLYNRYESFASLPLLLTIMLMTYGQYAEIPDKIHLFYQQVFQTLYSRHDASKGGYKRNVRSGLPFDDFIYVLSTFSAFSYINNDKSFTDDMLYDYLRDARESTEKEFDLTDFKKDLIESVCILVQDGLEYVYTHRSFQEYFTAVYIESLDDEGQKEFFDLIWTQLPGSIEQDIVIDILFESNSRSRLEKNFFIPALSKIRDLTNAESDYLRYFKYLNLFCNGLDIHQSTKITYCSDFQYNANKFLIDYIPKKFHSLSINTTYIARPSNYDNILNLVKEKTKTSSIMPLSEIEINSTAYFEFIEYSSFFVNLYNYAMAVLDMLKKKHEEKKSLSYRIKFPKNKY